MDCLRMRPDGGGGGETLPPEYAPEPDPIQGLEAFMERAGHKPWDLFRRNGDLMTSRLIFHQLGPSLSLLLQVLIYCQLLYQNGKKMSGSTLMY